MKFEIKVRTDNGSFVYGTLEETSDNQFELIHANGQYGDTFATIRKASNWLNTRLAPRPFNLVRIDALD